jgi:hypothetical protein
MHRARERRQERRQNQQPQYAPPQPYEPQLIDPQGLEVSEYDVYEMEPYGPSTSVYGEYLPSPQQQNTFTEHFKTGLGVGLGLMVAVVGASLVGRTLR